MNTILQTIKQIIVILQQRITDSRISISRTESKNLLALISEINNRENIRYNTLIKLQTLIDHSTQQQTPQMLSQTTKYLYLSSSIIFNKMNQEFIFEKERKHDFIHIIALYRKYFQQINDTRMMEKLEEMFKGRTIRKTSIVHKLIKVLEETTREYLNQKINRTNQFISQIQIVQFEKRKKKYEGNENKSIRISKKRSCNILYPLFGSNISNRSQLLSNQYVMKKEGKRSGSIQLLTKNQNQLPSFIKQSNQKEPHIKRCIEKEYNRSVKKPILYRIPAIINNLLRRCQNSDVFEKQKNQNIHKTQIVLKPINNHNTSSQVCKSPRKSCQRISTSLCAGKLKQVQGNNKTSSNPKFEQFVSLYNCLNLDIHYSLKLMLKKSTFFESHCLKQLIERNRQINKTISIQVQNRILNV